MFRFRNFVLLAMLLSGIAYESRCRAQSADCLEYPIYDDGVGDYLFVAEEYSSDPGCATDLGPVYVWFTPSVANPFPSPIPQTCGTGACGAYGGKPLTKKTRYGRLVTDQPFKGTLKPSTFKLGDGMVAIPGTTFQHPTAGITNKLTQLVWVKVKNNPGKPYIPILIFRSYLDYVSAGVPSNTNWPASAPGGVTIIKVGIEVAPPGAPMPPYYTPTLDGDTYSGTIDFTDSNAVTDTYTILTKTPLQ